jgi:endonuclease YncB( thermonuclease family)
MPKWTLLALGPVLAAGIVAIGAMALRTAEQPAPVPLPAALPEAAATSQPAEEPAPSPPPPVPPAPPSDNLSELPVQEVESRTVHTVPETEPGVIPHVTLQDRQGHPLARPSGSAPPPPSYVPSIGPSLNETASAPPAPSRPGRGGAAQPAQQAALPVVPSSLSGAARATGTVSLAIEGHTVRLYGVLPPASTDRCALGTSAPQTCAEVTQAMLAERLAHSASVTCQLPSGVGTTDPARVCLDATGVDIAGYLVGEGLAVADRHASGGYAGAESIARSYGKGLWRFR